MRQGLVTTSSSLLQCTQQLHTSFHCHHVWYVGSKGRQHSFGSGLIKNPNIMGYSPVSTLQWCSSTNAPTRKLQGTMKAKSETQKKGNRTSSISSGECNFVCFQWSLSSEALMSDLDKLIWCPVKGRLHFSSFSLWKGK